MSQTTANAPAVITNAANNKQQVPLRDYLNARVAPFLKKAITESLDAEAEFPLQWLGECLIHQSILYEGNPDRTNIRERFLYKFDDPKPPELGPTEAVAPPAYPAGVDTTHEVAVEQPPEVSMDNAADAAIEQIPAEQVPAAQVPAAQSEGIDMPQATIVSELPTVNGVKEERDADTANGTRDGDTEMGGTL